MAKTAAKPTALEVHKGEKAVEFIPFGAKDKISLTMGMVQKYIATPSKSGKIPTKRDCIHFLMLCKARGLNPWEGDCFMVGYDNRTTKETTFSLITAQQAFLKRAELHPEHDGMESGVIVQYEDGGVGEVPGDLVLPGWTLVGGWAKVHSKDKTHPVYRRLDVSRYKPKYYNKFWDDKDGNPAMMIVKCAEADALRSAYPTKLGGLYLREEMANIDRGDMTQLPAPEGEGGVKLDINEAAEARAIEERKEEKTATESLAAKITETSDVEIINELGGTGEEVAGPTPKEAPKAKTKKPSKAEPVDALWGMILQMANGDEEQALKVLTRYMKKAGRNPEGKNSYADLDVPDKNCIRPYVEADFNAQNGIAEPRMGLGE